ncbi:MAG TPA: hypothetical protein ENN55_05705, partial [Firmicutes bacterium]|nr:hypothetical protein [Bacillota bacterium]
MAKKKVKFSIKYKIALLIFFLIAVTMAVIFVYSVNMNIKAQKSEIKRSAKQVSDTLSALRLVTSWKSADVNWKVYEKYMEILSQLDDNILLMAIKDETGALKAFAMNNAVLKKDFPSIVVDKEKAKAAADI